MDRGISRMTVNKDLTSHKKNIIHRYSMGLVLTTLIFLLTSCASTGRYYTQKGALAGAGVGALAGQILGRNTRATLIGSGAGALIGAVVGNAQDQKNQEARDNQKSYQAHYEEPLPNDSDSPPGRWVTVAGRWNGNRWVPPHRQWVPVTP